MTVKTERKTFEWSASVSLNPLVRWTYRYITAISASLNTARELCLKIAYYTRVSFHRKGCVLVMNDQYSARIDELPWPTTPGVPRRVGRGQEEDGDR